MTFQFIGDENDTRTKEWGIKKGKVYDLKIDIGFPGLIVAGIKVEGARIYCPYKTLQSFNNNWKKVC